jgi:hypothetical protein
MSTTSHTLSSAPDSTTAERLVRFVVNALDQGQTYDNIALQLSALGVALPDARRFVGDIGDARQRQRSSTRQAVRKAWGEVALTHLGRGALFLGGAVMVTLLMVALELPIVILGIGPAIIGVVHLAIGAYCGLRSLLGL